MIILSLDVYYNNTMRAACAARDVIIFVLLLLQLRFTGRGGVVVSALARLIARRTGPRDLSAVNRKYVESRSRKQ
jgi:hypothetical protein